MTTGWALFWFAYLLGAMITHAFNTARGWPNHKAWERKYRAYVTPDHTATDDKIAATAFWPVVWGYYIGKVVLMAAVFVICAPFVWVFGNLEKATLSFKSRVKTGEWSKE